MLGLINVWKIIEIGFQAWRQHCIDSRRMWLVLRVPPWTVSAPKWFQLTSFHHTVKYVIVFVDFPHIASYCRRLPQRPVVNAVKETHAKGIE